MPALPRSRRLQLADGRALSWDERGPDGGRVVVHCHGFASSRLEPSWDEESLRELDVRLVVPDRPGYGGSDPAPDRKLTDWPADVAALLDALGVRSAPVTGWSLGGLHALACAAAMPERIEALALVAVPAPLDVAEHARALPPECRLLLTVAHRSPGAARTSFRAAAALLRHWPGLSLAWLRRRLPAPDRRHLDERDQRATWKRAVRAAWSEGIEGPWPDARILASPWGFDLADVHVPVRIWHGARDRLTPPDMARWLEQHLPLAEMRWLEQEGHLLHRAHSRAILEDLLVAAGAATSRQPSAARERSAPSRADELS